MCVCDRPSLLSFRFPNSPSCDPTIHSAMKPAMIRPQKSCSALVRVRVICPWGRSVVFNATNVFKAAVGSLLQIDPSGRLLARIVGSNPVGGMDSCLL